MALLYSTLLGQSVELLQKILDENKHLFLGAQVPRLSIS